MTDPAEKDEPPKARRISRDEVDRLRAAVPPEERPALPAEGPMTPRPSAAADLGTTPAPGGRGGGGPHAMGEVAIHASEPTPTPDQSGDRAATRSTPRLRPPSRRFVMEMPPAVLLPDSPTPPPVAPKIPLGPQDPLLPVRFPTRCRRAVGERLERDSFPPCEPDPLGPAVIEVKDLDAAYEDRQVLYDITFQVHRGEILAILGGSGSGKTTLLKHLIGLLRPARGTIRINWRDITQLEGDDLAIVLKGIGMLFQYSALFNSMTVGENVALPLREYTDLPEEAIAAIVRLKLALVGLPGIDRMMPNELSGGMKKRVALARAVALDPDVVFFDEPASGLDPIAAAELDALINHLNSAFGTTMVIVTHDLQNAFNVAHRILMLDRGRVVAIGTPGEVRANEDPWVRAFLARESAARDAPDERVYARIAGAGRVPATGRPASP